MRTILVSDFRYGTKKNIGKFILAYLFSCIVCIFLYKEIKMKVISGKLSTVPGMTDDILYFFGGIKKYTETENHKFEVPVVWMTVQLLVSSSVFLYPVKDLFGRGTTTLLQYGSRSMWWLSKCIWSIIQVLIIYIALFSGIITANLIVGRGTTVINQGFSQQICISVSSVNIVNVSHILLFGLVFPVFMSITAALVQVNLSIAMGPVLSLMIITAYQILSAYTMSWWLLGNYSMLLRLKDLVVDGVNPSLGSLLSLMLSIVSVVLGTIYFNKRDILEKES